MNPFALLGLLKCSVCESFMAPDYTQKRRKDGSVYRMAYYRCTKAVYPDNAVCTIKHLNADHVERLVIQYLADLIQHADRVKGTVEDLNRDQKEKVRPFEQEAIRLRANLDQLDREIDRFVRGVEQGTVSVKRLEQDIRDREQDQQFLESQHAAYSGRLQTTLCGIMMPRLFYGT